MTLLAVSCAAYCVCCGGEMQAPGQALDLFGVDPWVLGRFRADKQTGVAIYTPRVESMLQGLLDIGLHPVLLALSGSPATSGFPI